MGLNSLRVRLDLVDRVDQEKHSRDSSSKNKSTSGREEIQKRKNGGVNIPLGLWVRLIGLEARVQTRKDLGWERQGLCSKVNLHVNKVLQSCIVTHTFTFHLFTPECSLSCISLFLYFLGTYLIPF